MWFCSAPRASSRCERPQPRSWIDEAGAGICAVWALLSPERLSASFLRQRMPALLNRQCPRQTGVADPGCAGPSPSGRAGARNASGHPRGLDVAGKFLLRALFFTRGAARGGRVSTGLAGGCAVLDGTSCMDTTMPVGMGPCAQPESVRVDGRPPGPRSERRRSSSDSGISMWSVNNRGMTSTAAKKSGNAWLSKG